MLDTQSKCQGECGEACPTQNQTTVLKQIQSIEDLKKTSVREEFKAHGIKPCPACIKNVLTRTVNEIEETVF